MYSDIKSIQYIIAFLKAYNIRHIVLSPGTKNIPFAHSVESDDFFTCYSIVDERSAAFFALGLMQELREPIAISCTSGTAVANYSSAVYEAWYQKLPLVIITADRHPYYLNQLEDQMIPQQNIFSKVCKKAVQLPIIENDKDAWYCNRLLNEVFLELRSNGDGPIHINVPVETGIVSFNTPELPEPRIIQRLVVNQNNQLWVDKINALKKAKKILLIYGQNHPISKEEEDIIHTFTTKYNCAIAVDHLSNIKLSSTIETFMISRIISDEDFDTLMPEIVISLHGNYTSYIRNKLVNKKGFEHWLIDSSGDVADPFKCLTTIFKCSSTEFFEHFVANNTNNISENMYLKAWRDKINTLKTSTIPFSDLYVVQKFMHLIPENSILHLANSSSVRLAQHFELKKSISVYCNRGTNGIDGSCSTFMGSAIAHKDLSFLLIGDLSFFYDMNAIWNRYVGKNIRILLNNNEGAGIFHYNIGKEKIPTLNLHTAAEHFSSAKAWVESCGFVYLSAKTQEEFDENLPLFIEKSEKPIFFEVFTKKDEDAKILKSFYKNNMSQKAKLLSTVKKIIRK